MHDVTLGEEVAFLRSYLEIEETRFPERLSVSIDIAPEAVDARVPHLILQPLVENSIRHGVEKRSTPTRISVTAVRRNGELVLSVMDEGPGLPEGFDASNGGGMGLANVRERLARLYGPDHELVLRDRPGGGVEATMSLPYSAPAGPWLDQAKPDHAKPDHAEIDHAETDQAETDPTDG